MLSLKTVPKAIALISGGLDSALAASLVKSWGIDVVGLHLISPFGCTTDAEKVAKELQIPLIIKEKGEAFIELVEKPQYGYGSQMNPCIDCRIYMFELAEKTRIEQKADFIITGEVVGQRPLSQNKNAMKLIDRKSPVEDLILRPLSGGNIAATLAEKKGWVKRENLLKISGRGRGEQIALAKTLSLSEYSSPGGGCLLTEKAFSSRLKDFYSHPTYKTPEQKMAQASLLRLGRHFRLSEKTKVIVARTEAENNEITRLWKESGALFFKPANFIGPSALVFGSLTSETKQQVTSLLARYGKKPEGESFKVESLEMNSENQVYPSLLIVTEPTSDDILNQWRIGIT